jgi:hypothetical protein
MKNLEGFVDEWGNPVEKKEQVIAKETVLESYQKSENDRLESASKILSDIENRVFVIGEALQGSDRVTITNEEEAQGSVTFDVEVAAGDLSSLEDDAKKSAEKHGSSPEEVAELFSNSLSDMFGGRFDKNISDAVWDKVRRLGEFTGSEVEIESRPEAPGSFKNALFKLRVTLYYEHPLLTPGALESAVLSAIDAVI